MSIATYIVNSSASCIASSITSSSGSFWGGDRSLGVESAGDLKVVRFIKCNLLQMSITSSVTSSSTSTCFWGRSRGVGVESGGDLCVVRVNKCNIVYVYH